MTEPTFLTDEGFATLKAMYRLRKVLQREGQNYKSVLHKRCAVGLSTQEFNDLLAQLVVFGWCSLQEGEYGATMVVLNPEYNKTHRFQPDEVVADACKTVVQV